MRGSIGNPNEDFVGMMTFGDFYFDENLNLFSMNLSAQLDAYPNDLLMGQRWFYLAEKCNQTSGVV